MTCELYNLSSWPWNVDNNKIVSSCNVLNEKLIDELILRKV